jgi:hypothetical protein
MEEEKKTSLKKQEYMKSYYERNKEHRKSYQEEYNKMNKMKIKEYQRAYFQKRQEKKPDKVSCPVCFKFLSERYLKTHMNNIHHDL